MLCIVVNWSCLWPFAKGMFFFAKKVQWPINARTTGIYFLSNNRNDQACVAYIKNMSQQYVLSNQELDRVGVSDIDKNGNSALVRGQ